MTALVSYSTGTVSVAAGGTTVTGVGTLWAGTVVKPGDMLQIGNFQTVISDVTDTTHLVIPPWGGGVQSAVAYKIWQVSPQRFAGAQAMQTVNDLVAAFNTSGYFVFVSSTATVPDPSLGSDGQYAFQPTTGKTWAKVAGVWSFLGVYKAFNLTGAYNGSTTYSYGDVQVTSGSSYIYINATPSAGNAAPNATYWQLLASVGPAGATGATGAAGSNGTNGAGYGGTSTTSLAIGTGSKAFTTQSGLAYTNGARVRATATAGATGWVEGVATYSGTTLTITSDKTSGSGTGTAWNLNVAGEPGSGGGTLQNAYGQCKLVKSGSNIVLIPDNGNLLTINGVACTVPDAGVSLAATSLTAGTTYLIYATASAGVVNALEASTTAHATSTTAGNKGTEIKSGDDTRSLVGQARPISGPAWVDSSTQAFVLSYFNRGGKGLSNFITTTRSTASVSFVELNSEIRCEFLTWADENVLAVLTGSGYAGVGSVAVYAAIGFDGATPEDGMASISDGTGGAIRPVAAVGARPLSEGYHYATVLGAGNGSTGTFNLYWASAAAGFRSALKVMVRG
jgi:hypothetical protein